MVSSVEDEQLTSKVKAVVEDRLQWLDKRYTESLFLGALFTYTLLLVTTALDYGPKPQLFPLLAGIPLLGLILLRLGMLNVERLRFDSGGMFQGLTDDMREDEMVEDATARYGREAEIILWLAGALALIWVAGFQIALLAFVFLFVFYHERDLYRAVGSTLLAYALLYVLFIELLSVELYQPALLPDIL